MFRAVKKALLKFKNKNKANCRRKKSYYRKKWGGGGREKLLYETYKLT